MPGSQRQDLVATVVVVLALLGVDLLTPLGWIGNHRGVEADAGAELGRQQ